MDDDDDDAPPAWPGNDLNPIEIMGALNFSQDRTKLIQTFNNRSGSTMEA